MKRTPFFRRAWLWAVVAGAAVVGGGLILAGCGATRRPDGGTGLLPVGSAAPDLAATDQHGTVQRLADQRGRKTVVYFYPKDATPGCTKQACAFRDAWDRFQAAGVQVFGVSSDDQKSHEAFAKEQKLPFPILADPDHAWARAFGVPLRLGMTARVTFLIDAKGKVAKTYPDVDPALNASEVLADAAQIP